MESHGSTGASLRSLRSDHDGAIAVSAVILAVVLLALGTTTVLLGRTMAAATNINEKAERIAQTGRGINESTDAVLQLNETNQIASSILATADPLEDKLAQIVSLAREIDQLGASINATAGGINGSAVKINATAKAINATAKGINSEAAEILDVAKRIDADVEQINLNVDDTIGLARQIRGDTTNILAEATEAHGNAACIDLKVAGEQGTDGHCGEGS